MAESSNFRTLGFAIALVILFVLGWQYVLVDVMGNYGIGLDSNFTSKYTAFNDSLANLTSSIESSGNLLETRELDSSGTEASILTNMWQAVKLPFVIMKNALYLITSTMTILPVPNFVLGVILIMLTVLAIALIISAALRKDS